MTDVSFYLLPTASPEARATFTCKLIEKAYRNGYFGYILTDTTEQCQYLDNLLWTFRAGSFVPHQLYTGEQPGFEKIMLIGTIQAPEGWQRILFNMSTQYPNPGSDTERVLEVLDNSDASKAAARTRYRQYQQQGLSITTYKDW